MEGFFEEGISIYHTDESCPVMRDISADKLVHGSVEGMEQCSTCRNRGRAEISNKKYYNGFSNS